MPDERRFTIAEPQRKPRIQATRMGRVAQWWGTFRRTSEKKVREYPSLI